MRIKSILWAIVFLLVIIIISTNQQKGGKLIKDGIYENCYIISLKEDEVNLIIDGKQKTLYCPIDADNIIEDKIADISIENGKVEKVIWKEGVSSYQVEAVNAEEGWIRTKISGTIALDEKVQMYIKDQNQVRIMTNPSSLINFKEVSIFIKNRKACAIVADGTQNRTNIKVLLHGEEDEIYHEKVKFTASKSFEIIAGKQIKTYHAGQEVQISEELLENQECEVQCSTGKIRLLTRKNTSGYPEYRGKLLIQKTEKGYLIVNELPLEKYLYSVVSSEMPSSYPEEALKAQAICARTYALYQMSQAYYSAYGAHVDDTVNSQVYNNVGETKESRNAVKETKGLYLSHNNEPIPAYFYSTSFGMTSDASDVWLSDKESPVYLKGHFQGEGDEKDLSSEEAMLTFLNAESNAYEREEPWFRWSTKVSIQKLSNYINTNIENGQIGEISDIKVIERSAGGVLKEIKIIGEQGEIMVRGEYQIRKVLCPKNTKIVLQNGEKRNVSMLPSGYFRFEKKKKRILLSGGGYGHGVGLSQNGAKAMANLDHSFKDILLFYYPETNLLEKY